MRSYLPAYDLQAPGNLQAVLQALAENPGTCRPFAGGTDLMVLLEAGTLPRGKYVSLWGLPELRGIEVTDTVVTLGALTTYADVRAHSILQAEFPMLTRAAAETGGVATQNRGTLGGNIANASPAGDTLPVLLATDAAFVLGSSRGERSVAAADFWTSYRRTALAHDELVLAVRLPLRPDRALRYRKVGTRRAQAISKVVAALAWRDSTPDGVWRDVRVAFGSVAATPIRATRTEAALEGRPPTPEVADRAAEILAGELAPIDDVRSTAEYRRIVAARILYRAIREAGGW